MCKWRVCSQRDERHERERAAASKGVEFGSRSVEGRGASSLPHSAEPARATAVWHPPNEKWQRGERNPSFVHSCFNFRKSSLEGARTAAAVRRHAHTKDNLQSACVRRVHPRLSSATTTPTPFAFASRRMKAVVASMIGPYSDVLSLCDMPKPELLPGTALVRVLSAGLAFPDVLVVEGKHMMRKDPPFTPGQEICGQVVAVGEGVITVSVGQQVFGPCVSGGLAEFALVDAGECFSAPRAMDPHTAAGFELNYGTSWHGLVDLAGLRAGETLLVLGASGGIGLSAIAIGVARGARVVAAASSDARLDACRQAGAHVALSYAGGGKALKAALTEAGVYGEVDVVLDPVGGELSEVPPLLQPGATEAAAPCGRGCSPVQQRLQPHASRVQGFSTVY